MFKAIILLLPWKLKRLFLIKCFKYEIHPTASIGFSFVYPQMLKMGKGAYIGHLNMCKSLDNLELNDYARIGNLNWIAGYKRKSLQHYKDEMGRVSELVIGTHTHITHRHLFDCTNSIIFGAYTTFAGFNSQILTHSIDISVSKQKSHPVKIGNYCFIGTKSVCLAGAGLPDYTILGASSLLNECFVDTYALYAGVPAKKIKELATDLEYFKREEGSVL